MENKASALWHISKNKSAILETDLPPKNANLYEIKTLFSLVSLGTERLVAKGKVPQELYQDMAVPFMEGGFDFPIKYGYSLVGQVINSDDELNGKIIHLLHPHQNKCYVERASFSVVPDHIPPQRATLVSNLETALNAIWDAGVSIGDRVAVLGFGTVGALLCRLLSKIPGLELHIYENHPGRVKLAADLGFSVCDASEVPCKFDVSFNISSAESALQFCLDHTGKEGRVVELSWYGNRSVQLNLGTHFHSQRLKLISSQVSHLPSDRTARWDYKRRKQTVFNLLQDPDFDLHLTNTLPFEAAPDLFDDLREGPVDGIGYCLAY